MRQAKALHLSRCALETTLDGSVQLIGKPEKKNESFSDLPGYGGLPVAWVQLVYHDDAPCCPGFGDEVEKVMPSDLGDEASLRVYRRRDGRGFPHGSFYNFVVADASSLPPSFEERFVEVEDSDPVYLRIVRGEWMLRKPVAGNVHVHAALQAPGRRSGGHVQLSEEQQRVLDSPKLSAERGVIRILAAAGSGKTTTLLAIAEASTRPTVYVVFNKSMQEEADGKFAHTFVDCRTWDSLSRTYVQRHLNNGHAFDVVDDMETRFQAGARLLWRVVRKFCQSADDAVTVEHVQQVDGGVALFDENGNHKLSDKEVARHAQVMYDRAADCAKLPDHSVVLKMCQLDMRRTGRRLSHPATRRLLCDEFQDVNPAQADIAHMETTSCLVVAVGDPGQSIYGFRGACQALQDLQHEALASFKLSGSFRFGYELAGAANLAQSLHVDDNLDDYEVLACRGMAEGSLPDPGIQSYAEGSLPDPGIQSYTVICKTNRQAITHALDLSRREPEREIKFMGEPLKKEFALYQSLSECETMPFVHQTYTISSMGDARKVGCMLKDKFRDFDLDRAVTMWDKYGQELLELQRHWHWTAHHQTAMFCTVHQAKGLEWDTVVLGSGCGVKWEEEIGVWQRTHSAVNCLYVAVTRARKQLYIPDEVMALLRPPQLRATDIFRFRLSTIGTHQLFHVIPKSRVEQVETEGLKPDSDSRFVRLSGCKSLDDTHSNQELESLYVVDVGLDILNTPNVRFRMGGKEHELDQLDNLDWSTVAELHILVPRVPRDFVRWIYPLHPNGSWQSRHGKMSATQWFTAFGSDRDERAGRIAAGSEAAMRGASGMKRMIEALGSGRFRVPSQSQAGCSYEVDLRQSTCQCPDFQTRGGPCKHILAAKKSQHMAGLA